MTGMRKGVYRQRSQLCQIALDEDKSHGLIHDNLYLESLLVTHVQYFIIHVFNVEQLQAYTEHYAAWFSYMVLSGLVACESA